MKKDRIIYSVFLLAIIIICTSFFSSPKDVDTGTSSAPATDIHNGIPAVYTEFIEGEPHKWSAMYRRAFSVYTANDGLHEVNIQDVIFDEQLGAELFASIMGDLQTLFDVTCAEPDALVVYIVKETITGKPFNYQNTIYCTPEDILSGSYRESLVGAAYELEPWKYIGLAGYAFGHEVDEAVLRDYYQNGGTMDVLSLFPAYFLENFLIEEDTLIARETAVSFVCYVVEQRGANALFAQNCDGYKQDWIDGLNIGIVYTDPYAGFFDGYNYILLDQTYPLIVITDRGDIFHFKPILLPASIFSPKDLKSFLYHAAVGTEAILEKVERDASVYLDLVQDNYREPVTVYLDQSIAPSHTYIDAREIYVNGPELYLHELTHILTGKNYEYAWRYEAIAEYIRINVYNIAMPARRAEYFEIITDLDNYVNEHSADFGELEDVFLYKLRGMYIDHAGEPQTQDDINPGVLLELGSAITTAMDLDGLYTGNWGLRRYVGTNGGKPNENGNELIYNEAYLLGAYLIDNYSFEAFLGFCLSTVSEEEAFGKSYDELKTEWLDYLHSEYSGE